MSKTSSMGRGMMALLAVGARHAEGFDGGTVADVAARLGKDRSQVSRSLKGAQQEGFLTRSDQREYSLDWSILTDAQLVTEQRLKTDGLTALEGLASETNEACFLGVLERKQYGHYRRASSRERQPGGFLARPPLPCLLQ